jgi:peptide deformylase
MRIVTVPNPVLSSPTIPVTEINSNIKKIVADMEKVLIAQDDPPGVGLAANQVGLNLSIFLIKPTEKSKTKVFINPRILQTTPYKLPPKQKRHKKVKLEGCLSIPRIWGPVKRAEKVLLKYQDITGKEYEKWFSGFEATIIQHEMDHLSGVVFTQRSIEQKRQLYREENDELVKIEY